MSRQPVRCVIAFGGNLADPDATFKAAISELERGSFRVERVSPVITTAPVGCEEGAPPFRNGALTGFWSGTPHELLALCHRLEEAFGRPSDHPKSVSRTLDLDIILFGTEQIDTPDLIVPHPRAKHRDFVLIPMREIAPELLPLL